MRRWYIRRIVTTVVGIAAALAVFYILFSAFLMLARDAGETERREVVIDLPGAGAPEIEFAEDIDVPSIEIYREGDGPAPAWYRPDEEMLVEWYANVQDCDNHARCGLQSDGVDYNASVDWMLDVPLDAELQGYIWKLCEEAGVPYTLVIAVIEAESTYRADVISSSGDWGLMQINSVCHEWLRGELGIEDFLDPRDNVRAGVYILAGYYRLYGYASGALVAYNQGQQSAERLFAVGVYETEYSRRVIGIRWRLEHEASR